MCSSSSSPSWVASSCQCWQGKRNCVWVPHVSDASQFNDLLAPVQNLHETIGEAIHQFGVCYYQYSMLIISNFISLAWNAQVKLLVYWPLSGSWTWKNRLWLNSKKIEWLGPFGTLELEMSSSLVLDRAEPPQSRLVHNSKSR